MKRKSRLILLFVVVAMTCILTFVFARPSVFNESFWQHAHCIKIAGMELEGYAEEHDGKFPFHPNGYGDALLLLNEDCYFALTGPGYDATAFHEAKRNGTDLPEHECGRIYIQGLTKKCNPEIALLFDKIPTPGGDHCHFPHRLWAPLGREVWFVGSGSRFVAERDWPQFAKRQVELLVEEGMKRREAERLFAFAGNRQ